MLVKQKIWLSLLIVCIVVLGSMLVWQRVQAQTNTDKLIEQASRDSAMQAFRIQYAQALDKITIQGSEVTKGVIIYWTENVTQPGKIILHASVLIGGNFVELPRTQDVTELANKAQGK